MITLVTHPPKINSEEKAYIILNHLASKEAEHYHKYGTYADFYQLSKTGYLDERFKVRDPCLEGYCFEVLIQNDQFKIRATPLTTNRRSFYIDNRQIVYFSDGKKVNRDEIKSKNFIKRIFSF